MERLKISAIDWLISELQHCLEKSGHIEVTPTLLDRLDVIEEEIEKDNWIMWVKDPKQLDEVFEYYEKKNNFY